MTENYKFFQHNHCEFFPCHTVKDSQSFNCLFCYCPLYALKQQCGGNFTYSEHGIKDCSQCAIPHSEGGYQFVMSKMDKVMALAKINK